VTANNVAYARCPRLSCHGWLAALFTLPPKAANPANHLASGLSGFVLTTQLHKSVDKTASSVLMTLLPVSQESPLQKQSNVKYLNNTPWCTLISHKYFFNIS